MPIYPAVALLIGSAMASEGRPVRIGTRVLGGIFAVLFAVIAVLLAIVWRVPATGEISQALSQNPEMYTLSLGHMADLTVNSFAYLKLPLAMAGLAFAAGALGLFWSKKLSRAALVTAAVMVLFVQAARVAMVRLDAYFGSYPLAQALEQSPPGQLIEGNAYYAFSSVFFYTDRTALLWNGRMNNLEYGSYAPGAPDVFIDNDRLVSLWNASSRSYLLVYGSEIKLLETLVGSTNLHIVKENAGNYLLTNHALP